MKISVNKLYNFPLAIILITFLAASCSVDDRLLSVDKQGRTVVERFGRLKVEGVKLLAEDGRQIQLRGISSHGLQWFGRYANEGVLRWLRDDWNMQVWRAAMYLREDGYITQRSVKSFVTSSVEAAINLGLYVIIDWHVHHDQDPNFYKDLAIDFFTEMAQLYGSYPNVIYEICNEPNGSHVTWNEVIKPYAQEIISVIRQYDPDNIIIVGTPNWSQDVDIAALNPINGTNIMYTLHFYAGSHGQELKNKAAFAIERGLPIFVTECGTSQSSGGGGVYEKEFLEWLSFLKKHQISWVNWSLTNKGEDSGLLRMNTDREGKGGWTDDQLSQSGRFIRKILKNEIKIK
ncbi:MAG: glycoside hydrolase family 5 protein [Treponema sp.]|nr:glycoside hydrolase family 5 protein [Treponema sp.]